jgi:hypothetical protein
MNHPYFTEQVVADHQNDLLDRARHYRLLHKTSRHDGGTAAAMKTQRRRSIRRNHRTRTEHHKTTPTRTSPLPLFNLLLAAAALVVAVAAVATDNGSTRPSQTVITQLDHDDPASATGAARTSEDEIPDANQIREHSRQTSHTGTPAGNCTMRDLIVRC